MYSQVCSCVQHMHFMSGSTVNIIYSIPWRNILQWFESDKPVIESQPY